MLPDLSPDLPLEQQLRQARRAVCIPGQASAACAALVDMSLRLAADPAAEGGIREAYRQLQQD